MFVFHFELSLVVLFLPISASAEGTCLGTHQNLLEGDRRRLSIPLYRDHIASCLLFLSLSPAACWLVMPLCASRSHNRASPHSS